MKGRRRKGGVCKRRRKLNGFETGLYKFVQTFQNCSRSVYYFYFVPAQENKFSKDFSVLLYWKLLLYKCHFRRSRKTNSNRLELISKFSIEWKNNWKQNFSKNLFFSLATSRVNNFCAIIRWQHSTHLFHIKKIVCCFFCWIMRQRGKIILWWLVVYE